MFSQLGVFGVLWIGSNMILHPKRRPLEERHHLVNANPSDYGMILEPFEAPTQDGQFLKGYIVHPHPNPGTAERTRRMRARLNRAGVKKSPDPRGTVILMHGRGGLKENMLTIAQRFIAADLRCIVYDARAHGESGGTKCTYGLLERSDVSMVLDHIEAILSEQNSGPGPVVAFGNSLGAAVMLQTIPHEPRIIAGVAAAPFADMREVVTHSIGNLTSHRVPEIFRSTIVDFARFRGGFRYQEIAPENSAGFVKVPVFVTHGSLDKVIPINHARRVFQKLPESSRKWQEIPDAYHFNILAKGGDDLYEEMIHFYLRAISQHSS